MKRLTKLLLPALAIFTLASCTNSDDLSKLRADVVDATYKSNYNITNLGYDGGSFKGKRLNANTETDKEFYDIYINEDYKNTLLKYDIKIKDITEFTLERLNNESLKKVNYANLYFEIADRTNNTIINDFYASEKTKYVNEIYNKEYGITAKDSNDGYIYDFGFVSNTATGWLKEITDLKPLKAAIKDSIPFEEITLSYVYLPTFFVRATSNSTDGIQYKLEKYVFTPIYYAFTYNGQEIVSNTENNDKGYKLVDSKISTIKTVTFEMNKAGYLLATPLEEEAA